MKKMLIAILFALMIGQKINADGWTDFWGKVGDAFTPKTPQQRANETVTQQVDVKKDIDKTADNDRAALQARANLTVTQQAAEKPKIDKDAQRARERAEAKTPAERDALEQRYTREDVQERADKTVQAQVGEKIIIDAQADQRRMGISAKSDSTVRYESARKQIDDIDKQISKTTDPVKIKEYNDQKVSITQNLEKEDKDAAKNLDEKYWKAETKARIAAKLLPPGSYGDTPGLRVCGWASPSMAAIAIGTIPVAMVAGAAAGAATGSQIAAEIGGSAAAATATADSMAAGGAAGALSVTTTGASLTGASVMAGGLVAGPTGAVLITPAGVMMTIPAGQVIGTAAINGFIAAGMDPAIASSVVSQSAILGVGGSVSQAALDTGLSAGMAAGATAGLTGVAAPVAAGTTGMAHGLNMMLTCTVQTDIGPKTSTITTSSDEANYCDGDIVINKATHELRCTRWHGKVPPEMKEKIGE